MTELTYQELPNVEDERLKRFLRQIDRLRNSLVCQTLVILEQAPPKVRTPPAVVALGLLQRLAECSVSIELLAAKGRTRDCAVLLVTVMELRLDLQYISRDSQRADLWLDHAQQHRKPWPVTKQLKELFPVPQELEAEQDNYRRLSMAKHGNPVGGLESFPIGLSKWALVLPDKSGKVPYLCALLYCLGTNISQGLSAGFQLLRAEGFRIDDIESEAEAQIKQLHGIMEQQIIEILTSREQTDHLVAK